MARYYANHNPVCKEIHDLEKELQGCHINEIKNGEHISRERADSLRSSGYNGCKHCIPEWHTH